MSDRLDERTVWLLVPDASRTALLVDEDGTLPSLTFRPEPGQGTIEALGPMIHERGFDGPIVDCLVDQSSLEVGPRVAVAELSTPTGAPPAGLRWGQLDSIVPGEEFALTGYVQDRLDEWRGRSPVPSTRSPWCRPGWYDQSIAWTQARLTDLGSGQIHDVARVKHWGISTVMRIDTADRRTWFKGVNALFAREPVITAWMHEQHPELAPPVLAVEPHEAWLLLGDLPGAAEAIEAADNERAVATLVALQHEYIGRSDELIAAGFTPRPLDRLAADFDTALSFPFVASTLAVTDEHRAELLAGIERAVSALDQLGLPYTLAHGDFHPGNVVVDGDRLVIFDWSDAAVTNPLVDIAVWAWWLEDDAPAIDALWHTFATGWADLADPAAIVAARPHVEAICGAFHTISYAYLLESIEPRRRPESFDGLTGFLRLLEGALGLVRD